MNRSFIILASASPSRAAVLEGAGVSFRTVPAAVDEAAIHKKLLAENKSPAEIGMALAREKAKVVSARADCKDALVIGADQILEIEGRLLEKPKDMAEAHRHLQRLRGKTHRLLASVAVFENGKAICEITDQAVLTMRPFSDSFLDRYLERAGKKVLTSVGAYQLEGEGAQLFETVEGDFFTILGLPLIPLLAFLRTIGALPE